MTPHEEYEKQFEHINELASSAANLLVKVIQKTQVNPFCQKYRISFWSGMGGFGFQRNGNGTNFTDWFPGKDVPQIMVTPQYRKTKAAEEMTELLKILTLKSHPNDNCEIGCYMVDYIPDTIKRRSP